MLGYSSRPARRSVFDRGNRLESSTWNWCLPYWLDRLIRGVQAYCWCIEKVPAQRNDDHRCSACCCHGLSSCGCEIFIPGGPCPLSTLTLSHGTSRGGTGASSQITMLSAALPVMGGIISFHFRPSSFNYPALVVIVMSHLETPMTLR